MPRKMFNDKVKYQLSIEREELDRLHEHALKRCLSVSQLIRRLVQGYMAKNDTGPESARPSVLGARPDPQPSTEHRAPSTGAQRP